MERSISIIIPAFNEENTICQVLDALLSHVPQAEEIVVVDDGSHDRTVGLVEETSRRHAQVRLVRHARNQGKTAALITGFKACTGDVVVIQDADLEYDPVDIPSLVQPILAGKADVVYGSRFMIRRAARVLYFRHYLANKVLTFCSNLLTDLNFTDIETGYKAFDGKIIRNMIINSSGFGFEVEVTAKVAKLKCRVYEVPISYYGRTYEEGKKISFKDGVMALFYILKYNLFVGLKSSFTQIPR